MKNLKESVKNEGIEAYGIEERQKGMFY